MTDRIDLALLAEVVEALVIRVEALGVVLATREHATPAEVGYIHNRVDRTASVLARFRAAARLERGTANAIREARGRP